MLTHPLSTPITKSFSSDCGQQGHVSAQCGMEAAPKTCYRCNETGHISRDCPQAPEAGAGGFGGRQAFGSSGDCYKCGQPGHIARSCPTAGGFGGARGAFSSGGRTCYNCGGVGHLSRECTSAGGATGSRCYNCNETGHISRECPKPAQKSCYVS
ncbi:hypothetical protein IE53DRAFT_138595 [Violaceomyces palustris]|uniref:Uncharacterized protein n=1 Tax=Violaceomyces palustris TaxID=1673888 RepID=A0ACD0NUP6_9BASI|nr:hypothetical protein IE53DRAFT_138595 [Violaceomyces palustris]